MNQSHSFPSFFLPILVSVLVLWSSSISAAKETTNNPYCSFASDAIPGFTRTCIASTAYYGKRCFYTYIPDCALAETTSDLDSPGVPLVFDIHGLESCPLFSEYYTGWKVKADENCFVLVLPTGNTDPDLAQNTCFAVPGGIQVGIAKTGGCCCTKPTFPYSLLNPSDTDDLRFLRQTAAVVVREVPFVTSNKTSIDTKRIYMAGHSNGCVTSLAMAAVHSDLVAAVGCHAGSMFTPLAQDYIPTPIWMVIGTRDPEIKYEGSGGFFMPYLGAETMHSKFAVANECASTSEVRVENDEENTYSKFASTSCKDEADVVLIALDDVGHTPYLGDESLDVPNGKGKSVTLDTTQMAWDFVKTYSLVDAPTLDDAPAVLADDEDPPNSSSSRNCAFCVTLVLAMITINFGL